MKSLSITAARVGMLGGLGLALSLTTAATASPKIYNLGGTDSTGDPVANYNGDNPFLENGSTAYQDRVHVYREVPGPLVGDVYLETRNSDKGQANYSLSFDLAADVTLYLFVDNRMGDNDASNGPKLGGGVMDWVAALGFKDTGMSIGVDEGNDGTVDNHSRVYSLNAVAGHYSFGAQNDTTAGGPGNRNMYAIACGEPVPEPATLALFGLGGFGLMMIARKRK
ncbi:MAG: PEP-CTERM sorting domain-containing protein [Verrucomicrobia bacterium]|nr:PEP-CTERM sorting domain-containing protein [Verrucomicrobiota bacterium]MBI3869030.1 PEP-CTERM sorting domain-containing protein [Verrucomicrobiota bacterium]